MDLQLKITQKGVDQQFDYYLTNNKGYSKSLGILYYAHLFDPV